MAKVIRSITPDLAPLDYGAEDLTAELRAHDLKVEAWLERKRAEFRKKATGDLVGEIVKFQVADGYAQYMIEKHRPFTLVHLDILDGYHANPATIRGYRLKDAQAEMEWARRREQYWAEAQTQTEKFFQEHLGKQVHYHNGFGQFVRGTVVKVTALRKKIDAETLEVGEFAIRSEALVGKWDRLTSDAYHVRGVKENRLFRPNITCIYEASAHLQKAHEGVAELKAIDLDAEVKELPKPPSGAEMILRVAKMDGIDLGSPEGHEWLKEAIETIGSQHFRERFWNRVMVS